METLQRICRNIVEVEFRIPPTARPSLPGVAPRENNASSRSYFLHIMKSEGLSYCVRNLDLTPSRLPSASTQPRAKESL